MTQTRHSTGTATTTHQRTGQICAPRSPFLSSFLSVQPQVKVSGQEKGDAMKLHCQVYGFHPRAVDVKWMNGEDEVHSYETTNVLPNPDGTYQIRVSAEVTPKDGDRYSCYVDHSSLEEPLLIQWDAIDMKFSPDVCNNPNKPHRQRNQTIENVHKLRTNIVKFPGQNRDHHCVDRMVIIVSIVGFLVCRRQYKRMAGSASLFTGVSMYGDSGLCMLPCLRV
ncbi:unnamed protein product [Ranitomeya imitator]|uniref:Ig-like domain-containing protein n=1 Tax=Ranitomeya imitator TaxID=111125 RepID=A0ABN9M2P3_9NEOB|nr:unnamed protein product [Ranitomeya imitator]